MQEQSDKLKYTAVYINSWMSGSNMHVLPKIRKMSSGPRHATLILVPASD